MQFDAAAEALPTLPAALALGNQVAAGAFGTVYRATFHGEPVAVKSFVEDPHAQNREAALCQELMTTSHPNIVKYFDVRRTDGPEGGVRVLIVMEHVSHSLNDVLSFLATRKMRMTKPKVRLFFKQLAAGLGFLHSNNIAHRDIRPQNILICLRAGQVKIADFGSAKRLTAGMSSKTYISSRWYRAPEMILDRNVYTVAVDMWAFGCVLAETAQGSPIFRAADNSSQLVCTCPCLQTACTHHACVNRHRSFKFLARSHPKISQQCRAQMAGS